jgi:alginate O-acetyltransferase complex protein AlgI
MVTGLLFIGVERTKWRQVVLLTASIVFYAFSGIVYFFLLLCIVWLNYIVSLRLQRATRYLLVTVIVVDTANLFFFKYAEFTFEALHFDYLVAVPTFWKELVLPAGISFYTFQIIAYQIDVWKRKIPPASSLLEFATYVMFFPQLIAGPIMRGRELLGQLRVARLPKREELQSGGFRFLLGYCKKVVLVNHFLGPKVDGLLGDLGGLSTAEAWCVVFLFGFQIYLDFSGYCDMAIGIARCLGIKLRENFRTPYLARSPAEFWNRWNITLSHWIRDYIYIPLGGSRCSRNRNVFNLIFTMGVCGLWHGAAYGFIIWGLYHGCLILCGRLLSNLISMYRKETEESLPRKIGAWLLTFLTVQFGWVFFRITDWDKLAVLLGKLFNVEGMFSFVEAEFLVGLIAVYSILHVAEDFILRWDDFWRQLWWRVPAPLRGVAYLACFLVLIPFSLSGVTEPFIYFRF